jgi:hypothetical protein
MGVGARQPAPGPAEIGDAYPAPLCLIGGGHQASHQERALSRIEGEAIVQFVGDMPDRPRRRCPRRVRRAQPRERGAIDMQAATLILAPAAGLGVCATTSIVSRRRFALIEIRHRPLPVTCRSSPASVPRERRHRDSVRAVDEWAQPGGAKTPDDQFMVVVARLPLERLLARDDGQFAQAEAEASLDRAERLAG